jgi:xanthine dehydrogenase FAD-binding subunit
VPFLVEACRSVGGPAVRNQGTLGGNVANAAACADSLPSLVCLDSVAHLLSPKGERQMKVSDLIIEPHKTKIQPGELLTHISFALPPEKARSRFIKIGRRKAQSISRLSLGAIGSLNGSGKVDYIRITPGAAVATAVRFEGVEKLILGETPSQALFVEAGEKMAADMIAQTGNRWSTPYKEIAIKAITERALKTIFEQE